MPQGPAEWVERIAIQDLVVRFSDAVTRGDWEAFEDLWLSDGVWEESAPFDLRIEGASAICAHVTSLETVDFFVQMVHGAVVTLESDERATSRTTIHSFARAGDIGFENLGIYYDELRKVAGEWRFAHRRLENIYVESAPLTGDVTMARREIP